MRALFLVLAALVSTTASAQYRFQEGSGSCRDAAGQEGLNTGVFGPCADLRGLDLSGRSFVDADLRGANFDGAKLTGAYFLRADLRGASFDDAQLRGAVFWGANLTGASMKGAALVGAKLNRAVLRDADLRQADLRSADLHSARFVRADLRGARFSANRALLEGAKWDLARVDETTQLPLAASAGLRFESQAVAVAE